MSAKTQPTDQSKDCNELSIQNGRETTPIAESGVVNSSSIEAPKKTSRTGRVLKPSAKQQAANDASASRVSRITGNESQSYNLTFISSVKETDEYYAAEEKSRERAPKVQTMEQVLTNLGSAVTTQTRPLRPRN